MPAVLAITACGGGDDSSGSATEATRNPLASASSSTSTPTTRAASDSAPTVDELREGIEWEGEFTIEIEVWDRCATSGGELRMSATIVAEISADEVTVVIEGRSHNDFRRFRIEATAMRSS